MSELSTKPSTEILIANKVLEQVVETSNLLVHNDEINTFDYVIASLMDICDMDIEQAEQCTLIIHYRGKYGVKSGSLDILRPLKDAFIDRGISATIE